MCVTLEGMPTTTVSSKGQVTIPAALVRELELAAGTKMLVVPVRDGLVLLRRTAPLAHMLAGATRGTYGDATDHVDRERATWT